MVAQSGLSTWSVAGEALHALARELRTQPGIDMVVPFGATLHVSGADGAGLKQSLAPFRARPGLTWTEIAPSLEDVFIGLMNTVKDNYQ